LPVIAAMVVAPFTVTVLVANEVPQAMELRVYVMVTEPAFTPVTKPLPLTVAIAVLLLIHVPPDFASESCVVKPAHTVAVPVIAPTEGVALTVIDFDLTIIPQTLFTI